ncbi:DUF2490 domain-containing protein [Adhaeribacter sp. BT258]|uniref:DUF2490 domain-containing protein n=1 Tax=Adhaeribacter terrigena TaxID=2793070 RepID=A0ABS1C1V8_9BACT|nr:DUF2490 domain-containing protein [Adhaeribacter terrigena]MBK0403361.1 DUF2490 domain-containing protein [Adhaeribacter terrigena]
MLLSQKSQAQGIPPRVQDHNINGWLSYSGDHNLSEKWGVHTEFVLRRYQLYKHPMQFMPRFGVNYNISKNIMLTLGYAYVHTYPYGEFPASEQFPEHRSYQQFFFKGNVSSVSFQHRYRLEQRFIRLAGTEAFIYTNRFRYHVRAAHPFKGKTIDDGEFYVAAANEFFINFGKKVGNNIFDQNRASAVLGYRYSKALAFELGYLNQIVAQRNGFRFEYNHTLLASISFNFDFPEEKKVEHSTPPPAGEQ